MSYKLSKYNYYVNDAEGCLRLYNSLAGKKSLLLVNESKKNKIQEILQDCNNSSLFLDEDFKQLYTLGYIVDLDTDEDLLAHMQKMDVINDSGLLLTILPTEDCNFRCQYCYEDHKKGAMSIETQNAIVKFVQKNIANYTSLTVAWFGGEPLEALDVIENLSQKFIKICNTARKTYQASMTTNGYNLNIETFKKLLDLKVYNYQITLDGLKRTHDKYRYLKDYSGTFDRIVSNLKEIHKLSRNTFMIDIRTNFTKESIKDLASFLSFCENLFENDPRFSLFVHLVGNWGGDDVKKIQDEIITNDSYRRLIKSIVELEPKVSFHAHLKDLDAFSGKCYAGLRNSYVIGSDRMLYKCTESFNLPENQIGVLNLNGDFDINKYKHALWLDCMDKKQSSCSTCSYFACCLGGPCPKVKIQQDHSRSNYCPRTKGSVRDILLLLDNSAYTVL